MAAEQGTFGDGWHQQQLVTPSVLEARLRIGAVPSANHWQAMYEIFDPSTKILIAQKSWPHLRPDGLLVSFSNVHKEMMAKLDEAGGLPDPFPDKPI